MLKNARSMLKKFIRRLSWSPVSFQHKSVLKCVSQPEIAKNSLKTLFWELKVIQSYQC